MYSDLQWFTYNFLILAFSSRIIALKTLPMLRSTCVPRISHTHKIIARALSSAFFFLLLLFQIENEHITFLCAFEEDWIINFIINKQSHFRFHFMFFIHFFSACFSFFAPSLLIAWSHTRWLQSFESIFFSSHFLVDSL